MVGFLRNAPAIHREGISLGPTGAPVWTAQQLEVLRASEGSMVPNKLLGDVAPQVDQSAEMFRDGLDAILYLESGFGLLKLGYGLAKAGMVTIVGRLVRASEGVIASRAAGGSVGAMRRLLYDAEASAQHHIPGLARPGAAAGPINGQAALDASIEVGANTSRRVGIDYARAEYVVFDEHAPGLFHGHVRSWDELTNAMQAQLRRWGMAHAKGRILIGD